MSMKQHQRLGYHQPIALRHQGRIVVLARSLSEEAGIHFNVLNLQIDSERDELDWTGFEPLPLPTALRPIGMSLFSAEMPILGVKAEPVPFQAVSDQQHIYLFQQSSRKTLLVNRFLLIESQKKKDGSASGKMPVSTFKLEPAWEVRFQRSGKRDVSGGPKDTTAFTDPLGDPFVEPTLELPMVRNLEDGRFTVLILPTQQVGETRWQIFSYNSVTKKIDAFSFRRTEDGLFDVSADRTTTSRFLAPDQSISLADAEIQSAPSALLYMKQEQIQAADGKEGMIRRYARVLLALKALAKGASQEKIALLDLGIGTDGRLARAQDPTPVPLTDQADYALRLTAGAYVDLVGRTVTPTQSFTLEAWLRPAGRSAGRQRVLGGQSIEAPAPILEVVDGLRLRAGISGGYTWKTREDVLAADQWRHVAVTFVKSSPELRIYINGMPVETDPETREPNEVQQPIAYIGAPTEGFLGQVEEVRVWERVRTQAEISAFLYRRVPEDQRTDLIGYWSLNEGTGLETEDLSKSKCHGRLQGPKWIVSSAPVAAPRRAYLHIDENGLLTASEMLDFAASRLAPTLLEGADGLIHAYFAGPNGEFQVAHCDIQAARATYSLAWATAKPEPQEGLVKLVARDPGPVMNQAEVIVAKAVIGGEDLCQVRIKSRKETQVDSSSLGQVEEIWTGVPRRLDQFLAVLQGRSTGDPLDSDLKTGRNVFFDFAGRYPVSRLPIQEAGTSACLLMVSLKVKPLPKINWNPAALPLSRVIVTPAGGNLQVQLVYQIEKDQVTHTWRGVPADVEGFADTLNGVSSRHDYGSTDFGVLYRIAAGTSIPLLVPRTEGLVITELTIANAGSGKATLCRVTLKTRLDGTDRSATWDEVPRNQDVFAMVLQHFPVDPTYDYSNARGDHEWIAGRLVILTDHAPVAVANTPDDKPAPDRADLLAAASLFEAIPESTRGRIGSLDIPAAVLQEALVAGVHWSGPSPTFAVGASEVPTNGLPAFIEDTAAAALVQPGTAGGWLAEPPRNALLFHGGESLEVSCRRHLAIHGSLSMEAWAGLERSEPGDSTILHFRDSGADLRYWLGIETRKDYTGWCLESRSESVNLRARWPTDLNLLRPYTCEFWLQLGTGSEFRLEVNGAGGMYEHLVVAQTYVLVTGSVRFDKTKRTYIEVANPPKPGDWHHVALVSTDTYVGLYLDGSLIGEFDEKVHGEYRLESLKVHAAQAVCLSELRVWNLALTGQEIKTSAQGDLPRPTSLLQARYPLRGLLANCAPTRSPKDDLDLKVESGSPSWSFSGPFGDRLHAGYGGKAAISSEDLPAFSWTHLAGVYRTGYALRFTGQDYAEVADDVSLAPPQNMTLETWLEWEGKGDSDADQVLIGKATGAPNELSYQLQISKDGTLSFSAGLVPISGETAEAGKPEILIVKSSSPMKKGQNSHVAVTLSIKPLQAEFKQDRQPSTVEIRLYQSGVETATLGKKKDYLMKVQATEAPLRFARSTTDAKSLNGSLAEIRLWSETLSQKEISDIVKSGKVPGNRKGLITYWRFSEMSGKIAYDSQGSHHARLSSNEMWRLFEPTARWTLYANGKALASKDLDATRFPRGDDGLRLGGVMIDGKLDRSLRGGLDEVRLWDAELTGEQIGDNLYSALWGNERHLAAYWKFDAGSGTVVVDETGRGADARFSTAGPTRPEWGPSTAPLSDEAPPVRNVPSKLVAPFVERISGRPSVVEYTDTQRDAEGATFSVLKRLYAYERDDALTLLTGFKIDDLTREYLGQVQSAPTLVGYIEGPPPVPSENLSRPLWQDATTLSDYNAATAVTLTEASDVTYTYTARTLSGGFLDTSAVLGVRYSVGIYLGELVTLEAHSFDVIAAAVYRGNMAWKSETSTESQDARTRRISEGVALNGLWEEKAEGQDYLNSKVGRRFLPRNDGYVLVRSSTADLYAQRLRGSGAFLALQAEPNPNIPEDVNVLSFRINPRYVKNGTLDGKVGLVRDPDYRDADFQSGSYFKPLEAYQIKQRIDDQWTQIQAFYAQFQGVDEANSFRGKDNLPRKSFVNTYIWTAGGGLHVENEELSTVRTEYSALSFEGQFGGGIQGELSLTGLESIIAHPVYLNFEVFGGGLIETEFTKTSASGQSFGLDCTVETDGNLQSFDEQGNIVEPLCPGKVDAYRFMTFYLAPEESNFQDFFTTVVDQDWLRTSGDQSAVLLRQVQGSPNKVWRVLHRVTYVSRVPPPFRPVPDERHSPAVIPPPHQDSNGPLLAWIEERLSEAHPTPPEIAQAMEEVLAQDLEQAFPWWREFFQKAREDPKSEPARLLSEFRQDLLGYLVARYETLRLGGPQVVQRASRSSKDFLSTMTP